MSAEGINEEQARAFDEYLGRKPGGWKPEVFISQEWHDNRLVFATEDEAARWAKDVLGHWFVPSDSRAHPTDEEPNHKLLRSGKIEQLGGRHDFVVRVAEKRGDRYLSVVLPTSRS